METIKGRLVVNEPKRTSRDVVDSLKHEAKISNAANAVFHMWALRKRARGQVTVHSLSQKMKNEGFSFTRQDYERFLSKLADLGLGRLERNASGKIKALREVKLTLQSIGAAAVGQNVKLERFTKRNEYKELLHMADQIKGSAEAPKVEFPVSLTVVINGKPVNFRVPTNLEPEEIAELVRRFHEKSERGAGHA